jgi:hypothetical protein
MDRSRSRHAGQGFDRPRIFGFGRSNAVLLISGVVAVFIGYFLLNSGSTTAAPLLLLLGYAVFIPAGLIWGLGGRRGEEDGGGE